MSKFFILTKILLKNSRQTQKKGKIPKTLMFFVLMAMCFAPLVSGLIFFLSEAYDVLKPIEQQGIILALGISVMCAIIFFFGIFFVINTFYFSKDVENLLPLPFRPSQILGAKFSVVILYEYITETVILLPFLAVYGIKSGAGIIYYMYSILIFLSLPVIPIVIDSLVAIVIMRFTNIGSHKERFKTIGGVIALIIGIGINVFMQRFQRQAMSENEIAAMLLSGNNSLVKIFSRIFPGSSFAVEALVNSDTTKGLLYMLLFAAVTLTLIILLITMGEKLYFKGVIGVSEAPAKRKNISDEEFAKTTSKSSSLKSYTMKELRVLFRTSVYFMNCVLMNFVWPIALIPALIDGNTMSMLKELGRALHSGTSLNIAIVGGFGIVMFTAVANATAPTAISREGSNLFVSKYLPVSYKQQIMGKVMSAFLLDLIGLVVFIVFAMIVINPPVYIAALVALASVFGIIFTCFSGLFIDLNFPKLHWDNEQKAVKQNMNVLANMAVGGLVAFAAGFCIIKFNFGLWQSFGILVCVFGVLDLVLYKLLSSVGTRLYEKLEG